MERRILGRTGLSVSVMGLGCGGHSRLGLSQNKGDDNAVCIVRAALEQGVNFLDTAEAYGTEPVVGRALKEAGARESVVLSTKVSPGRNGVRRTPDELREAAEGNLQRLQTDTIDILHLHGVSTENYAYCRDELVPVLQTLRDAGKIRFIGITEAFGPDPGHAMLTQAVQDDVWDVMMVGFNFVNQSARERVFPFTTAKDVGILDMFAVRRALQTPDALRALLAELKSQGRLPESLADEDDTFDFLFTGADAAVDLPDAAYRFCRDEPGMQVILSGTGDLDHLAANIASLTRPPLPAAMRVRLVRQFAGVDSVSGN